VRILIIGGDGMLGHQLLASLSPRHEVRVTLRREPAAYRELGLFDAGNAFFGVDVRSYERLLEPLAQFAPEAVVNAAGIVKQRPSAGDHLLAIEVNALFPHRLSLVCRALGARLVHLSTDCVFSGGRGGYREDDVPDADDLYGRSKLLGELRESHCVTLRTSMIGLEIARRQGLLEWYLASRGTVKGYRRAIFSGFTTLELARLIEHILTEHHSLSGLWHAAAAPIDKCGLLLRLGELLVRKDVQVEPDDSVVCDRSLCAEALRRETGYQPPSWDDMLREQAEAVRRRNA
jgi:dTDP-4-dehydrorhamnose reductase